MNLDLTLRPSKNGYTAQGLVDLRIGSLTREDFLHARLKDARVLFPIGYPFTFANLPRPSIDVSAASLVWDNGAYQDIAFTIPIAKEAITLPTPVVFPLFGRNLPRPRADHRVANGHAPAGRPDPLRPPLPLAPQPDNAIVPRQGNPERILRSYSLFR